MKVAASLPVWMTRVGGEDGVGLGVHVGRTVLVGVNVDVIVGIWTGGCEPLRERTPGKQQSPKQWFGACSPHPSVNFALECG